MDVQIMKSLTVLFLLIALPVISSASTYNLETNEFEEIRICISRGAKNVTKQTSAQFAKDLNWCIGDDERDCELAYRSKVLDYADRIVVEIEGAGPDDPEVHTCDELNDNKCVDKMSGQGYVLMEKIPKHSECLPKILDHLVRYTAGLAKDGKSKIRNRQEEHGSRSGNQGGGNGGGPRR